MRTRTLLPWSMPLLLAACVTGEYHVNETVTAKGVIQARLTEIDEYKQKFTTSLELKNLYGKSILFYFGEITCFRKGTQGVTAGGFEQDVVLRPGELKRMRIACKMDNEDQGGPFTISIGRIFENAPALGQPPGKQLSAKTVLKVMPKGKN